MYPHNIADHREFLLDISILFGILSV